MSRRLTAFQERAFQLFDKVPDHIRLCAPLKLRCLRCGGEKLLERSTLVDLSVVSFTFSRNHLTCEQTRRK